MLNNAIYVHDPEFEELAPGHALLYGQYTIERHLIDGGFGTTYLARDSLDRQVVIKECFPCAVCRRVDNEVRPHKPSYQDQYQNIIRSFLREALRLAKFEHPNIVKVHQVFQENNTAYIAMDYVNGMDLLSMLDIDPGRLTNASVEELLRVTLDALDYVHDLGMLHRDISPDNLLVDADNKLTLIDFGAAREDTAARTRALSAVMSVKDGYSPHEFYYADSDQLPSSDIYSVGATFYHLVTGFPPPECQKRLAALSSDNPDPYKPLAAGRWAYDKSFLRAIDRAMSVPQKDRFQSAREWLDLLENRHSEATDDPNVVYESVTAPTGEIEEPVAEVELEPSLVAKISWLVEDTNSKLEPLDPGKAQEEEQPQSVEDEDNTKELVDMFGRPIDDVDTWLKEQDKNSNHFLVKQKKKTVASDQEQSSAAEDSSVSGLSRVFKKISKIRSRSVAMPQH